MAAFFPRPLQFVETLEKFFPRPADKPFESEDLCPLLAQGGLPVARFGLSFQLLDAPQAGLEFLVDVARDDHHVLKNLLLVKEFWKVGLELFVELLELGEELRAAVRGGGLLALAVMLVHLRIQRLDLLDQAAEVLEVALATFLSTTMRSNRSFGGSARSFSAIAMCSLAVKPKP